MADMPDLKRVMDNLDREITKIEGRTQGGCNEAARIVLRDSKKLTPVDTGNLKASGYFDPVVSAPMPATVVGYTAEYALPVHENLEARHVVGEAKFLEKAVKRNFRRILRAIADEAEL